MSYSSANQQPRPRRVAKGNWARMRSTYTPLSCQGKDLQTRSEAEVWVSYLVLLTVGSQCFMSVLGFFDEGPVRLAASFKCLFDVPSLFPFISEGLFSARCRNVPMTRVHVQVGDGKWWSSCVSVSDFGFGHEPLGWYWSSQAAWLSSSSTSLISFTETLQLIASSPHVATLVLTRLCECCRGRRRSNKSLLPLNVV